MILKIEEEEKGTEGIVGIQHNAFFKHRALVSFPISRLARLAEQAKRYDEMVETMKKIAKLGVELTIEERNLVSMGYKNVIGARRASWRILSSIKQKEETKGREQNVKSIKEYRQRVEDELSKICNDILSVIDQHDHYNSLFI